LNNEKKPCLNSLEFRTTENTKSTEKPLTFDFRPLTKIKLLVLTP